MIEASTNNIPEVTAFVRASADAGLAIPFGDRAHAVVVLRAAAH